MSDIYEGVMRGLKEVKDHVEGNKELPSVKVKVNQMPEEIWVSGFTWQAGYSHINGTDIKMSPRQTRYIRADITQEEAQAAYEWLNALIETTRQACEWQLQKPVSHINNDEYTNLIKILKAAGAE